jgi:predicted unusual protein kinase regulating ubiquinone biosynthesis (AarF/ABC1/UbiB family)
MAKDRIPTSRLARTARVSGLAAGQAARHLGTRAANLARGDEGAHAALERRNLEAAEQIVAALGTMKGAAMKLGQVMSFLDVGLIPEEHREEFQRKLGELRDAAPKVRFSDMRKVMESELGESIEEVFEAFETEPVAAASIGQVYRARLSEDAGRDAGREVAVKVQYPGVAEAVRSDLQNLGLLMRIAKRMAPGLDAKALTAEIKERLSDELDYEQEAQAQRAIGRQWRGHPFVVIPDVITSLSRERVLVTEWVEGRSFEEVRQLPAADRNRFGEIVFRFFSGSLYRNGHFSGDPHPGNYRLMPDGRVAFMDFGMTKRVAREDIEAEVEALGAAMDGDVDELYRRLAAMGFFDPDDEEVTPDAVFDHFHDVTSWYIEDREVTVDRALVSQVLIDFGDPRSRHWQLMRRETMPPQAMLARRMEALTLGVLGQLGATANWHRIAREWLFGDPPSTELGELEEPFHTRAAA